MLIGKLEVGRLFILVRRLKQSSVQCPPKGYLLLQGPISHSICVLIH